MVCIKVAGSKRFRAFLSFPIAQAQNILYRVHQVTAPLGG